jgi:hypothetical protein
MKIRLSAGLAAGFLLPALLAAPALAGPANVQVRVEGATSTLLPRTAVTTTTAPVNKDGQAGHDCSGTSAAGALERATAGNWTGTWSSMFSQYSVDTVMGASPGTNQYWAFWLNYEYSNAGICGAELQAGDDVLLFLDCFGAGCVNPAPLRLFQVPAKAAPGSTAAVLVRAYQADQTNFPVVTSAVPAVGATVTVGGQQYTTGSDGIANVTFTGSGPVSLRATKPGFVPSAGESTCLTTGADGLCGSVPPPDTTPPVARITGIRDGQRFSRRRAPRVLHGTVSQDPSGLWAVKLRLTRRLGNTCWYFSGSKERFLKRTCGKRYAFKVGDRADWSYLLPARLPRGRYVLDTYAIDNAFNHSAVNRVRFRVR